MFHMVISLEEHLAPVLPVAVGHIMVIPRGLFLPFACSFDLLTHWGQCVL